MQLIDNIKSKIHTIRGKQVMLDRDLARLFEETTKRLNQQVNRNRERFPEDFMFQLTQDEKAELVAKCNYLQNLKFSPRLPCVYTEHGVASLSGVLKTKKAVQMNIQIVRAFAAMRKFLSQNAKVFQKFQQIDQKLVEHDQKFEQVFQAIEDHHITPRKGIFFDGQVYDAHAFATDLIRSANDSIILIDNFIDESVLTLLSNRKASVPIIIYTKHVPEKLKLAQKKFNHQYGELRIKTFNKSHDRFLIIDTVTYHLGASLKDLGKRWFAFSRFEHLDIRSRLP